MNTIRFLLPALLLALAANPAQAQGKDQIDKSLSTGGNVRQADPPRAQPGTTASPAELARRQKDADARSQAERFPPKPQRSPPSDPSSTSGSSGPGK